ncbi:MAG TPA: ATP-dependent DNA helicase RecG [Trueperaceae bacterium]|nr:ATP-dependent DNA helicase RecG [Trueperaceae bacterium]
MARVSEMRERLRRPLAQELKDGCRNQVVVGGLERLTEGLARPFAAVGELLHGYGALPVEARRARLERALELLEADPRGGAGGTTPAVGREPGGGRAGTDGPGGAAAGARGPAPDPAPDAASSRAPEPASNPAPAPASSAASDPASNAAPGVAPDAPGALLAARDLDLPLSERLVDVGAQAPKKLAEVGVRTYRDLLWSLPRRYEDRRALPRFAALQADQVATVTGTVLSRKGMRSRRGMHVLRAALEDGSGQRATAVWFNQPWVESQLFPGQRLILGGRVKRRGRNLEIHVSGFEVDEAGESLSFGRIVGIYRGTQGLSQAYQRRGAHRLLAALPALPDYLPRSLSERHDLVPLDQALRHAHFPPDEEALRAALRRLKFDDFLFLELAVLRSRDPSLTGRAFSVREADLADFRASLPFELTGAQDRALSEILADMAQPRQMARLLQGDVGSGKTAVAAAAVYAAVRDGAQAALMAPTEVLARQHFLNLQAYLFPLGVRSELLTGAMTARERREARARLASGEAHLAVGTHALIQDGVRFADLGLAIVDEEHRFGVEQRRKLLRGMVPDVLVMSATPIPRSLALTYYGDLELSVIDALPPGRKPVATRLVNAARRREVYHDAWEQIRQGRQVYVVTPLIEDSEALDEVVSVTRMADDLRQILPAACRIEMLHGRLPGEEKDAVMERFRRHAFDLLVSTTVIEVGVDIPNATMMIVENAERFGLSQLHQLRGRVGRGDAESTCVLIAGERGRKTQKRLEIVARNGDGFKIAEYDLELRGPGELRGTRQSGLPDLSVGDLATDGEIIEQARELAKRILEEDPALTAPWASRLREELKRRSRAVAFREVV